MANLVVPPPMSILRMRLPQFVGGPGRAGAIGRQHRLDMMTRHGADELSAVLGQDLGDVLRILPPQRLAGQDDRAGIDAFRA